MHAPALIFRQLVGRKTVGRPVWEAALVNEIPRDLISTDIGAQQVVSRLHRLR